MIVDLDKKSTHICVVGGGSAGWMAALWIRQFYPNLTVTVIESSDIGILGAGEGTTPQFVQFLEQIGLNFSEVVKYSNGTIKNSIKFTGWGETNYYHNFGDIEDLSFTKNFGVNNTNLSLLALEQIGNGKNLDDISFTTLTNNKHSVKQLIVPVFRQKMVGQPYTHFGKLGDHALHFNANMLAEQFKKIGKIRNINVIEGKVSTFNTDSKGFLSSISLEDGNSLPVDFVFDCTGLARKIIGEFYKGKYISYKEYLPVNRAIPFTQKLQEDDTIPPYTEAIAMDYGWSWKIPTSNRFGCGYVFDSNRITDEIAKREIDKLTGVNNEVKKIFSFEAGVYETPWIKNCISLGLSSGFIEPLEATSIWVTVMSLRSFSNYIKGVTHRDENSINFYNKNVNELNYEILNFVYFHYLTRKTNTKFWKDFYNDTKTPSIVEELISNDCDPLLFLNTKIKYFDIPNWLQVGAGIGIFNKDKVNDTFNALVSGKTRDSYIQKKQVHLDNIKVVSSGVIDHKSYLQFIS